MVWLWMVCNRSKEGQEGQRQEHPQGSLITAPGSQLFVYILTSVFFTNVFCPNEAASSFFFSLSKTLLDFCQARSTSSANSVVCCLALLCFALTPVAERWAIKRFLSEKKKKKKKHVRQHVVTSSRCLKRKKTSLPLGLNVQNF